MFNVNWNFFIRIFIPIHKRHATRLAWLYVLVSGIKTVWETFYETINKHIYDLQFTGQKKWLEHVLNDRFDNVIRGIYIDNIIDNRVALFVFNKIETRPPIYIYNKWRSTTSYVIGERIAYGTGIYECLIANSNIVPSTSIVYWQWISNRTYLQNKVEYYGGDSFIVYVPSAVSFDMAEMKRLINTYKLVGKQYRIEIY